jgi:dCMP deaminase
MSKPNWDHYFLSLAHVVATRASCDRKHVGAVIVNAHHRIVSTGYNGGAAGTPDCDEAGHLMKEVDGRQSCVRTLHAESNALDYAGKDAVDCTIYTTVIPCYECAKRLVNSGIVRIVYTEYYESQNTKSVAAYLVNADVELVYLPARFKLEQLCVNVECDNIGRYDSGYCSLCDEKLNAGRGVRA